MLEEFNVGDTVEIIRFTAPQMGMRGVLSELRVTGEWWVLMEMETLGRMSWRESSMKVVESDLAAAHRVLGEDYFA